MARHTRGMTRRRWLITSLFAATTTVLTLSGAAVATADDRGGCARLTVDGDQTVVVETTTCLRKLTIDEGGTIAAPEGYSLSLTVNGVETGSALTETGGSTTAIQAGTYTGRVVLTVAEANPITWQSLVFPFRQALYVDSTGVVDAKSVLAAVRGGTIADDAATGVEIDSTGEAFNGLYLTGATYSLVRPEITLTGNGRSDFVGYGAAITATGSDTTLVVDGARIDNQGAVRTGVVADGGSNVIVKNSTIHTDSGTLPEDYQATVDTAYMEQAPWMLGLIGNTRATNLVGDDTRAAYINSEISSEGWGVLSTDTGSNMVLTSINSTLTTTGGEGYGSYVIGDATERFLGTTLNVDTYAAINRGGTLYYGDSAGEAVAELNTALELGMTADELAALSARATTINSLKWGVMWHGAGSVDIDGGTTVNTGLSTFLDKGQEVDITVDGSQGATLTPGNGILLQVMEDDDPGAQMVDGMLLNTGVYTEPTGDPTKVDSFDVTTANEADAVATFTSIDLTGDLYNGIRGGTDTMAGKNMVLTLEDSTLTGVVSASTTAHNQSTITSADYEQLGVVTNTASAVVNNGVIVDLAQGSRWTVTDTSYLSSLSTDGDSVVQAPAGRTITMTVDGVVTPIVSGESYTGAIVLTVE